MAQLTDIWKLLAGVAVFLLGMNFLEDAIRQMAGRSFKLFLKKQTASKLKAVLGGAFITGFLQSSSVVNLVVLAFVGANVIQLQHALAVILGANLGSTFTSWIIATLGFKFNIENIALPLAGIFGILMMLCNKESLLFKWSKFLFGIGFIFIGLNFIKTGMENTVKLADLSQFAHYPAVAFVLFGFIITALIQSSSATVVIVLSALNVSAIDLYAGTAIVLGSEVGTTIKLLLASVNSLPAKKRVAMGNLLFNFITALFVFIFLGTINRFITDVLGIKDQLMALVSFQTLVNILTILLFYPFLHILGKYLEKWFTNSRDESLFIHKVKVSDTELALVALENEVKHLILHTAAFTRNIFGLPGRSSNDNQHNGNFRKSNLLAQYENLKALHGESHSYAIQLLNNSSNDTAITKRLEQLIASNRNSMYAAKSMKDTLPDIYQLRNSANDIKYGFFQQAAVKADDLCNKISSLLENADKASCFQELNELYQSVTKGYSGILEQLYKESMYRHLSEIEISTLINFNREMYTAYKSFVFALKDFMLDEGQASYFDELPGFIR